MTPSQAASRPSAIEAVLSGCDDAVWVALDTEYMGGERVGKRWRGSRRVVSWQLLFRSGNDMVEWLVVPRTEQPLLLRTLALMLAQELGAPRHEYGGPRVAGFPVVLLSHAALVDVTTFGGSKRFLQSLSSAGGGLFSMWPHAINVPADKSRNYYHRVSFTVRDTMCFTNGSSLASMGESLGLPKLGMSEEDYANMGRVLATEPERFAEYAMRDCEIAYRYLEGFCGRADVMVPPTAPAFAAAYARLHITEELGITDDQFDARFRGVRRIKTGLEFDHDGAPPVMGTAMVPAGPFAEAICTYAARAYRGGINASLAIGWFPGTTYDHDVVGAYPLGMSAGLDPDFERPPVLTATDRELTLEDFGDDPELAPFVPGFGHVRFEFPPGTYLPSITVKTPNGLVAPLSYDGADGVSATAAEVVMALRMGAKVHALRFEIAAVRPGDGALLSVNRALLADRERAKELFGKGSPQERAAKLVAVGVYGKASQGIDPKRRRNLWTLDMEQLEASRISSPVHAAMGTAIIRCLIVAAINELRERGHIVHSATTDGFITNAPLDVVESLPLCGMRERLEHVRRELTDGASSAIFETKHTNSGLLNFTTRGNVGMNEGGVLARNGLKGYASGSADERAELIGRTVARVAPLGYECASWASAADMLRHDEDFHTYMVPRTSNPNFDLKRQPDMGTMRTVPFIVGNGIVSTPTFDTLPYRTLDDFERHKSAVKGRQLVSEGDYRALLSRATHPVASSLSNRDLVRFAVTAHRAGHVTIPALSVLQGAARLEWIGQFLTDGRPFTPNDWKNAGRAERKAALPEPDVYADMVYEMSTTPC